MTENPKQASKEVEKIKQKLVEAESVEKELLRCNDNYKTNPNAKTQLNVFALDRLGKLKKLVYQLNALVSKVDPDEIKLFQARIEHLNKSKNI